MYIYQSFVNHANICSIGLPTHLADIHARPEDLPAVTEKALAGIDVRVWPYPVAQQMLIDAVMELEQVG